ncbi:cation:proton antiporter [Leifsonia sp. 2MCAF36]|uniref:cation:proton antiporter n=1 Tax=Leifsonia sp. 2MCAF36 TaxID=3232988 RepID=UPI003F95AA00
MSVASLALVVAVGLLGPMLAARRAWRIPVVVGELAGGLIIGASGFRLVDPGAPGFRLLASIGFGLTMVVVGSHIPLRDPKIRAVLSRGAAAVVVVGVAAAVLGSGLSQLFGTHHAVLYGVILASSSAAVILPMLQSAGLAGASFSRLLAQIAVADVVCIIALPFVLAPNQAMGSAIAALAIAGGSIALGLVLRRLERLGVRRRFHEYSERHRLALELRLSLVVLFAFAAVAQLAGLSILFAGFALGLVLSAVGEPHRLARQLFGMTEGFFGPLFFVWLGASLDLRDLAAHPAMVLLGALLGLAAAVAHLVSRAVGLPLLQALTSTGQLGVPVAAVTLGIQAKALAPGEDAAILFGALVSIALSAVAVGILARRPSPRDRSSVERS